MYRAGACDRWLNYTMLEYRWTPRFIDYRFGLSGTEHLILEFMKVIERIKGQERCREILKALLCEYFLPPCNEENEPYKFCREDCEAVFETCHTAMMELVGAAKYFVEELGDNLGHAEVPDCEKHRYSAEYKAENSTCVHFGLFSKSTPIATLIILITIATERQCHDHNHDHDQVHTHILFHGHGHDDNNYHDYNQGHGHGHDHNHGCDHEIDKDDDNYHDNENDNSRHED